MKYCTVGWHSEMKQALLITAYKDAEQLEELIRFFPSASFSIYVHVDRKSRMDLSQLERQGPVELLSRKYTVNWGGRNHLMAILHLMQEALKDPANGYFHLISGQDFPLKPVSFFQQELDTTKNYMQYISYPVSYLTNGARDWFEQYHLNDLLDGKRYRKWMLRFLNLQRKTGFKRVLPAFLPQFFYGSTYWSLNRQAVQHVMDYTNEHPAFINRMKFTFCSEELYISSVLMNSKLADTVVNDNLRYIDWESYKSGSPRILDASDFEKVIQSGKLFARKFDAGVSANLRNKIRDQYKH